MTPSKRGGRQPIESPAQLKKPKQLSMDDYVISVRFYWNFLEFGDELCFFISRNIKVVFISICRGKRGNEKPQILFGTRGYNSLDFRVIEQNLLSFTT